MNNQFGKIIEYNKFLSDFPKSSTIRSGYFYTYKYNFYKYYPYDELKFYDYRPLTFVFETYTLGNKKYFLGLNFHHLPIKAREYWLRRIKVIAKRYFDKGGVTRIPGLNYEQLPKIMRKCIFGVRQYRMEAVKDLRVLDLDYLDTAMSFYANTYYGVTIKQIQSEYNKFNG